MNANHIGFDLRTIVLRISWPREEMILHSWLAIMHKTTSILYNLSISDISISDARENLSAAVSDSQKKPVRILKHGKPVAILINPSMYEKFVASIEELEDIAAFDEAMSDKTPGIPWHQVKKDLAIA